MSDKLKARQQPEELCAKCEGSLSDALENAGSMEDEQDELEATFEEKVLANDNLAKAIQKKQAELDALLTEKQDSETGLVSMHSQLDQMRERHNVARSDDVATVQEECGKLDVFNSEKQEQRENLFMCEPTGSSPLSVTVQVQVANPGSLTRYTHFNHYKRNGCGDCDTDYDFTSNTAKDEEACAELCAQHASCTRFSFGSTDEASNALGCRISSTATPCIKTVDRFCSSSSETCCSTDEKCGPLNKFGGHVYDLVTESVTTPATTQPPGVVTAPTTPAPTTRTVQTTAAQTTAAQTPARNTRSRS